MLINITFIDFNWLINRGYPSVTSVTPVVSLFGANKEALVYESIQDLKGGPVEPPCSLCHQLGFGYRM